MRIVHKLFLGFFLITILVGAVGFYGLDASRRIAESYNDINETFYDEVSAALKASSYAKRAESHLMLFLVLGNPVDSEKFKLFHDALNTEVKIIADAVSTSAGLNQARLLQKAAADIVQYGTLLLQEYNENPDNFHIEDQEVPIKQGAVLDN